MSPPLRVAPHEPQIEMPCDRLLAACRLLAVMAYPQPATTADGTKRQQFESALYDYARRQIRKLDPTQFKGDRLQPQRKIAGLLSRGNSQLRSRFAARDLLMCMKIEGQSSAFEDMREASGYNADIPEGCAFKAVGPTLAMCDDQEPAISDIIRRNLNYWHKYVSLKAVQAFSSENYEENSGYEPEDAKLEFIKEIREKYRIGCLVMHVTNALWSNDVFQELLRSGELEDRAGLAQKLCALSYYWLPEVRNKIQFYQTFPAILDSSLFGKGHVHIVWQDSGSV